MVLRDATARAQGAGPLQALEGAHHGSALAAAAECREVMFAEQCRARRVHHSLVEPAVVGEGVAATQRVDPHGASQTGYR